ncbi:MAG: rRNA maturation RNase YbeY [Gammaproteobacteria bacterium]
MAKTASLAPAAQRSLRAARKALPLVHLQRQVDASGLVSLTYLRQWVAAALEVANVTPAAQSLTLRVVGQRESARLNRTYRDKSGSTNILSFPSAPLDAEAPKELQDAWREELGLGDLVLCWPVVQAEARAQHKSIIAHTAHLVVHGTLHLVGYDHLKPREAKQMESLEVAAMKRLGFPDPYLIDAE